MKKLFSIMLAVLLTVTMLAGCSGNAPAAQQTTAAPEPAANEPATQETAAQEPAAQEPAAQEPASGEGPLIAYIGFDLSMPWFNGVAAAIQKACLDRGAREVLLLDSANSPDKCIAALDSAISQKVDVLIICPADQQLSQVIVDRCAAAGIKVLANDDGLITEDGIHIAPAQELAAYDVGESQGEWLANYVKENNLDPSTTAYMCMSHRATSSIAPRSEGAMNKFKSMLPDWPEDRIIEVDTDGQTDNGFNVTAATITANPDIETWLITSFNEEAAQGAARALEQAGKDANAAVVSCGGYLAKDEFKKESTCFKAAAYFSNTVNGTTAGNAAMDWYETGKVPYEEYKKSGEEFGVYPFGAIMVDPSNYKEIMGADAE